MSRPFFFGNYVSYLAGLAKMNFGQFMLFTLLGAMPWCFVLSFLGYYFGQAAQILLQKYGVQAVAITALLMVPIGLAARTVYNRCKPFLKDKKDEI